MGNGLTEKLDYMEKKSQKFSTLTKDGDMFNGEVAIRGHGVRTKYGRTARIIGYGLKCAVDPSMYFVVLLNDVGGERIAYYTKEGTLVACHGMSLRDGDHELVMDGRVTGFEAEYMGWLEPYKLFTKAGECALVLCSDMIGPTPYVVAIAREHDGLEVLDTRIWCLNEDGTVPGNDLSDDLNSIPLLGTVKNGRSTEDGRLENDMEKKNMIPFSIYAFRDGCKVIDSKGAEVEVLCTDRENNGKINIVGLDRNGQYLECDTTGESLGQPKRQVLFMDMDCYLSWLEEHRGLKRFDFDMAMEGHTLKTLGWEPARIIKVWMEEEKLTVLVYTNDSHEDIREYDFEGRWLEDKSSVMEMLLVDENRVV